MKQQQSFIEKSKVIHNNKFDYSKVNYINGVTKVKIICPIHGEFTQMPKSHLRGHGCSQCSQELNASKKKLSQEEIIQRAKEVHGNKYDYSEVEYTNYSSKIQIICPTHGVFLQRPANHINLKAGCPSCAGQPKYNNNSIILKAKAIHGNKFNYSKIDFISMHQKIEIICQIHGSFWQTPADHINHKAGCPNCIPENIGGFKPDKPAVLYYILHEKTGYYKIGITNKTLKERFGKLFKEIKIIDQKEFSLGKDAYLEEQKILQEFKEYRIINEDFNEVGGSTEFFDRDIWMIDKEEDEIN